MPKTILSSPIKGDYAMNIRWILLISLLALALGGCGSSPQVSAKQSTDSAPANPQEIPTEANENPLQLAGTPEITDMPTYPPSADKFVNLAKQDLANLLKIDISQISLIEAAEVTWLNSALGCPSPGKTYAAGRVPGYRIRLEANGVEYIYNTDLTGQVILCAQPGDEVDGTFNDTTPGSTQDPNIGVPIK
jgi:hypothetical protein